MEKKYVLEFLIHYLADESFRRAVLYREKTTLRNWGMNEDHVGILTSLDETAILDLLLADTAAMIDDGEFKGIVGGALREVGMDFEEAHERIWGNGAPCAGPGVAPLAAAAYGEGEVHVREVEPLEVVAGRNECITISGQGFSPRVAVGFAQGDGAAAPEVDGWIIDRHSDLDVHEYLVVEVVLPRVGQWKVFVRRLDEVHDQEQWRLAPCVVTAIAAE